MANMIAAHQWGVTSLNITKSTFSWKIPNFNRLKNKFNRLISDFDWKAGVLLSSNDVVKSPVFSASSGGLKWCLVMFCIRNRSGDSVLCFELRSEDSRFFTVDVNLSIAIMQKNELTHFKKSTSFGIEYLDEDSLSSGFLIDFESIDYLVNSKYILHNGEFHVYCEYELITDDENHEIITFENQDSIDRNLLDTFKKQWKNQEFCDFVLVAECGRKILANKFVLSAASPVFSAMLKNDFKEKQKGVVKIKDVSYDALEQMLHFMHSGKVEKLNHRTVGGILAAAEKYEVADLKNVCKEFLMKSLSIETALITVELCKKFNLTDLEPHVDEYVISNKQKIYIHKCKNISNMSQKESFDTWVQWIEEFFESPANN